jgi:hypothetical protein
MGRYAPRLTMTNMKRCSKCGNEYPATTEYFHKRAISKDGLNARCKSCRNEHIRLDRKENPEHYREYQLKWNANNPDRVKYSRRQYRIRNREKIREYKRQRRMSNPEKIFAEMRRWRENNVQHRQAYSLEYRQRNQDRLRKSRKLYSIKNANRIREQRRVYYLRNRAKRREQSRFARANRRARKRGMPSTFTNEQWSRSLNYFNGCCAVCGRMLRDLFSTHTAAADHWIPISSPDCPGTIATNMIPLCHGVNGCNNKKRNRNPQEWIEESYSKKKADEIIQRIEAYFEWVRKLELLD